MLEEKAYRQLVDDAFARIDAAFENVDPDLAESSLSQGTLSVAFPGKLRLILSPQTPVRQIWAAFKDRAWHFDRDPGGNWVDDRGRPVDLYGLVEEITLEVTGLRLTIRR